MRSTFSRANVGVRRTDLRAEPRHGAGQGGHRRRDAPALVPRVELGVTNFERDPGKPAEADTVCAEIDSVVVPRMERFRTALEDSRMSHLLQAGTFTWESPSASRARSSRCCPR